VSVVLRAEWTKARTLASNFWLLAGLVVATCLLGVLVAAGAHCTAGTSGAGACGDPAKASLSGVYLGQAAVVVLGVLMVSGEYATGMMGLTFAAMPRRIVVLAVKAIVLSGLILAAGAIAVLICVAAGGPLLTGNGYVHVFSLRAAFGTVLYLVLIGLLSLGIATLVRDAAAAVGVVLALLFLFPVIAHFTDPAWQRHLEQIAPMTAGLAIQDTVNLASQPIGPWAGLGVLAAWTAGFLLIGGAVLLFRDA
jgi:ABC-2 type transport system permease protein